MNILRVLPLMIACALSVPAYSQESYKDFYPFPETMEKKLYIKNSKGNTTSFVFQVKSNIGTASNIKMTAKVIGDKSLTPIPQRATFPQIQEGKSIAMKFVLPISEERAKSKEIKIQGTIEYMPDYPAMIEYVNKDSQNLYSNKFGKSMLINNLEHTQKKQLTSTEVIRFFPENKDANKQ